MVRFACPRLLLVPERVCSSASRAPCSSGAALSGPAHSRVVFSGIQPTGVPHLGNYFGFIEPWIDLQRAEPPSVLMLLSVVDLHALSLGPIPSQQLRSNTRRMAAGLIASGVDPQRTLLFRQSDVPEIAQLNWILGSLQTVTKLQRLPQYKEKASKFSRGEVPVGLLTYPVLQAADVLTFKGTHVPVGEDQSQHMNLLADLAYAFNKTYNEDFFPIPQQLIRPTNARVRSLREPAKKMSKSEPSARGRIELCDSQALVEEKCRKAVSDSIREVSLDRERRPAVANLIDLFSAVSSLSVQEVVEVARDWTVADLKTELAKRVEGRLGPIRERFYYFEGRPEEIDAVLYENGKKAREIGRTNVDRLRTLIGAR